MMAEKYFVIAYDKDGDVYTLMSRHQSFSYAKRVANALFELCLKDSLRRNGNGEPYDTVWVEDANQSVLYQPA